MIPLCVPVLRGNESRYLNECLTTNFVSSVGPFVDRFEGEFAVATGAPHAVACVNGTAGLHLALREAGVGPGDRVLVSDFTFIASANPIIYQGAQPVLIDSEEYSWNLDPVLVEEALADGVRQGRPIKAVMAVHILGQPADLAPIARACARHGAVLVEDAAEALGAGYTSAYDWSGVTLPACAVPPVGTNGADVVRGVGTVGLVSAFSFNGNKLITTGGGGMMTTSDPTIAKHLKHISTQAKLPGVAFIHDEAGFNYRLTNLAAAMGVAQLEQVGDFLAAKARIAARYAALCQRKGWVFHPQLPGTRTSNWQPSFLVGPRRDALIEHLNKTGIGARPLWFPLARQKPFAGCTRYGGTVADRLGAEGITCPCSVDLTEADFDRVLATLEAW
jgi:dTDP-4-amino-4,6-dideoxygalactose transaminase